MSLQLFKFFVNSLKQSLPRSSYIARSGIQLRATAVMEIISEKKDEGLNDKKEETDSKEELVRDKNRTRYKRRFLKRRWEDGGNKKENDESSEKKTCDQPFERIKRKKVAMLLGYCGVDYFGMQRNPGVKTIEEDLLKALLDAKYITEEDFSNQQNAQFQRSSRTDKGVSAARQVVSLKLPLEANIEEINSRLPPCIKVFGIKRATNKFNSKSKCNARTYSYTLPTYVFEPSLKETERKGYRISAEKITKVNEVLSVYKGTKSYHNFTEKKHYQDPSALRYMMSFTLERVFIESEMEFAELLVKGQSFMLHQIRKMVGLMIAVVRGLADMGMMEKAFGKDKVMIPTAPGLGLLLDKVHYERYGAKFKDSHDTLAWEAEHEAVERFKRQHIFPTIIRGEIEGNSMGLWLEKIKRHSFEPSDDVPDDSNDIADTGGDDDDDDNDDQQPTKGVSDKNDDVKAVEPIKNVIAGGDDDDDDCGDDDNDDQQPTKGVSDKNDNVKAMEPIKNVTAGGDDDDDDCGDDDNDDQQPTKGVSDKNDVKAMEPMKNVTDVRKEDKLIQESFENSDTKVGEDAEFDVSTQK